jgi:hypothetical protein
LARGKADIYSTARNVVSGDLHHRLGRQAIKLEKATCEQIYHARTEMRRAEGKGETAAAGDPDDE